MLEGDIFFGYMNEKVVYFHFYLREILLLAYTWFLEGVICTKQW